MNRRGILIEVVSACCLVAASFASAAEPELVAHWTLSGDARDASGKNNHGINHGVEFSDSVDGDQKRAAAHFDGKRSYIEVPDSSSLNFGKGDFSISVWVNTEKNLDDVLGDIAGKFDPESRTGWNFGIQNLAGVTTAQSNYRNVHFGIDAGKIEPEWADCGRPGNGVMVFALCVHDGKLFASTFEIGKNEAGHVYRYEGRQKWTDCGSPDKCNAVESLAVYDGKLYAGAARYLSAGSALPESQNENPGGKVYRYDGDNNWSDCGKLKNPETGESFTVGGMAVFKGQLYAGVSKPPGRGLYRYDGEQRWTYCGHPGHRPTNPVVYNGKLYVCSLDGGGVSRYEGGTTWTDVGKPAGVSQTYGFAVYRGDLYASSWPNGEVFRYGGGSQWQSTGLLGSEKESMGMAVYNGKLYAGTLPLARVYRYDGDNKWVNTGQLDKTPDVKYHRAWSMAVYQGRLFCGTLPSGRVYSIEAGANGTDDRELPPGWHHLAAIKAGDTLRLYRDGKLMGTSAKFDPAAFDISNKTPLTIGFGPNDYFNGHMRDLRIYRGALSAEDVANRGVIP